MTSIRLERSHQPERSWKLKSKTKSASCLSAFFAAIIANRNGLRRIFFWVLVAVYTICLPSVIFVFRALNRNFSSEIATKVPFTIILCLAVVYSILCVKKKRIYACFAVLAFSGIIIFIIMMFQPNVNKHIHIPEYVIMCWVLYKALSIDYKGSGIYLLIFLCAAMLGIIDELLQGIHPQRFYGWSDMLVNAAASLIGVFTLMGLKSAPSPDWTWVNHLRRYQESLAVIGVGAGITIVMCIYLFKLQAATGFWNAYPRWLFGLNSLFLAGAVGMLVYIGRRLLQAPSNPATPTAESSSAFTTAHLWIICPLALLSVMQALVVWVGISGHGFK